MKLKTKNKIAKNKKEKRRGKQKYNVVETRIEKRRKRKYFEIQSSISRLFYLKKKYLLFRILSHNFLASKLSNLLGSGGDPPPLVIFPPVTEKCNLMVDYKFLYTSLRLVESRVPCYTYSLPLVSCLTYTCIRDRGMNFVHRTCLVEADVAYQLDGGVIDQT